MASIITNGNVGLSTANGFRLIEAQNNPGISGTVSLASEHTVNLVFTSASANAVGVVLYIYFTDSGLTEPAANTWYGVLAELQQNTSYPSANNWVTRASKQLTVAEITNGVAKISASTWVVPFVFETPYAIDNAGASGSYYKWRLRVTRAGSGVTNNPALRTSNGTVPAFHLWSDVARTFADNDQVVKKTGDILTIDQTATMLGTLGTGETTYASAFVICKSANPACGANQEMVWDPGSAKTLTIDGTVHYGAHSCFNVSVPVTFTAALSAAATSATLSAAWAYATGSYQIHFPDNEVRTVTLTNGSAAVSWTGGLPAGVAAWANVAIPAANMATVSFPSSTNGSSCGFKYVGINYLAGRKASFYFYGERPPNNNRAVLAQTVFARSVTPVYTAGEIAWGVNHNFADGQAVFFTATTMPTGLVAGQIYYARATDTTIPAQRFFLYDTAANAIAGGATGKISFTSNGTTVLGNTVIVTTEATGWAVGDWIVVGGIKGNSGDVYTNRQILAIDGTQITVTPAFPNTFDRLAGHPVLRLNPGYGVRLLGNGTKTVQMHLLSPSNLVMDGVEKDNMGPVIQGTGAATTYANMPWDDSANTSKHWIDHCSIWRSATAGANYQLLSTIEAPVNGLEVARCNGGGMANIATTGYGVISLSSQQRSGRCIFRENIFPAANGSILGFALSGMAVFGCEFYDNVFEGYSQTTQNVAFLTLFGSNFVLERNRFFNNKGLGGALKLTTVLNMTGRDNRFDSNNIGILFDIGAEANCQLTDTLFGQEAANTQDFAAIEGALIGYQENSPTGAVAVTTTSFPECLPGSTLKVRDYNDTAGDIRSWHPEGYFASNAGKLVGKTYSGASTLVSAWTCTSDAIAGQSCAVLVTAQIANAAYYAGVYDLPALTVAYDGDQSAADAASAATGAQILLAGFSPAENGAQIVVSLSQRSDAGDDSGVTWSALTFRQRRYGKVENAYVRTIVEVTGDVVFNWATLPDNVFIAESDSATVAAYAGITIDHDNQVVTIDEAVTLAQLYDFTQYDLSQHIEVAQWFSTIDGTNYDCSYDIVVDGAALSGAGKKINMPANELTLSNGGSCSALVTDINGTLSSITFTGLVTGSEVRLFRVSDDQEISGGIESASGSSHTFNFTHTADVGVYGVVLSLGYENLWLEGLTLTAAPQSIPVSQRRDRVYLNP